MLSSILATDKDLLICDLAETYHIYDYRKVPVQTLGILVSGLSENTRIGMKALGVKARFSDILLAQILDDFNLLIWSMTKDGEHGINRPESYADKLIGKKEEKKAKGFKTGADFERARARLLRRL